MEPSVQRLQFLDLTDASENDQSLIERVLFTSSQVLEVPWYTERACVEVDPQSEQEWIHPPYALVPLPTGVFITQGCVPPSQWLAHGQPEADDSDPSRPGVQGQGGNIPDEINQCGDEEDDQQERDEQPHEPPPSQDQPPRPGGMYAGHPPTSIPQMFQMYQMVPSLSNVYVSNMTANVNVQAPYVPPIPSHYGHQLPPPQQQPPQAMYTHGPPEGDQQNRNRRQRPKTDKKREHYGPPNDVMSPPIENHPPASFPNMHPMQPYYIPSGPGMYMPHTVLPMYSSPMFNPYSHSPGPMVYPQPGSLPPGSEEYHENVQPNYHQPGPEMIVVGGAMRQDGTQDRRGPQGNGTYQVEEHEPYQNEQRLQEPPVFKPETENVSFNQEMDDQAAESQHNGEHFPVENREEDFEPIETVLVDGKQPQLLDVSQTNVLSLEQTNFHSSNPQNHEHLCYHTEVVVKLPKKKPTQVSEVEVVNNDVNNVDSILVNNNSSAAGRINEKEMGGHSKVPPNNLSNSNHSNNNSNVPVNKNMKVQQDSPVPISQNHDFPLIGQNVKSNRRSSDVSPEPEVKYQVPPNTPLNPTTSSPSGKSWASLFSRAGQFPLTPLSDNKGRPLARILPYTETDNTNVAPATSPTTNNVSGPKPERTTPPRTNGAVVQAIVPSSSFVDDPYLHRLGRFLCSYDLDYKIVSLQPRGLTNRRTWCYVNAILQALIACPPFYNLLKALPVSVGRKGASQTLIIDALVEFVNEFSPLPPNARIGKREKSARNKEESNSVEIFPGAPFEPSGIYKILDKVRGDSSFNVEGRQEDAEEFLSCLLNGLNDEMFELMKLVDTSKPVLSNGDANGDVEAATDEDDSEWTLMGPKNKSSVTRRAVCGKTPVSDIFRGQLRSRVQRAGDQSTDNVQPFFTLQLDIEKANSVKDALELLVGKDPLEGVTCSRTHQEIEAWTQMTLEDLPLVLILHLKCFDYKPDGCTKITKNVDFPIDLKVDPKLMGSMNRTKYTLKQRNYKLVAVVYHDGKEASKGHYVTDAYHVGYGCWIRYDDTIVRSVPELQVLKPKPLRVPYLLYYRRTDTIGTAK